MSTEREIHINKISELFSRPKNNTEVLLKLFHINRLTEQSNAKETAMCSKCLMPWSIGNFELNMRASNGKRVNRRNYQIARLQNELKSDKEASTRDKRALRRKIKRLQNQNSHVANYKCLCCNKQHVTKVQLRKRHDAKNNKSEENVTAAMITAKHTDDIEPDAKKAKIKKKKKKTAGLLIPPKATEKVDVASSSSDRLHKKNILRISEMLKQQKSIEETKKQQKSKLSQFFK